MTTNDRSRPNVDSNGLNQILYPDVPKAEGIELTEAIEIVLELARSLEFEEEFEWMPEHAEACGVVDNLQTFMEDYL